MSPSAYLRTVAPIFVYDSPSSVLEENLKNHKVIRLDDRQSSGEAISGYLQQETLLRSKYVSKGLAPTQSRLAIALPSRSLPLLPSFAPFAKSNNRPRIDILVQPSTNVPESLQLVSDVDFAIAQCERFVAAGFAVYLSPATKGEADAAWEAFEQDEGDRIIFLDPFEALRVQSRLPIESAVKFQPLEIVTTSDKPTELVFIPASIHSSLAKSSLLNSDSSKALGIIHRLPFDVSQLTAIIPPSVTKLSLFSHSGDEPNLKDLQTVISSGVDKQIDILKFPSTLPSEWSSFFDTKPIAQEFISFWAPDTPVTNEIVQGLSDSKVALTNFDAYALPFTGLLHALITSSPGSVSSLLTSSPSLLVIQAPKDILSTYAALSSIGIQTTVLFLTPWTSEDFEKKLCDNDKASLSKAKGVFSVDTVGLENQKVIALILQSLKGSVEALTEIKVGNLIQDEKEKGVNGHASETRSSFLVLNSFVPTRPRDESTLPIRSSSKFADPSTIQRLLFASPYSVPSRSSTELLRPDLHEDNYLLTVTENRRLTPLEYDRNIFHIEFSLAGTGMKYGIGDALGVHGWNESSEVLGFLEWYGLDPEAIVEVPARKSPRKKTESRTIFQLFQQNLDVFGKPPKTFYERLGLSPTATLEEARILRFISSEPGASMLKKWTELDTVNYFDVLKKFPEAKKGWGITELVEEIAPIKERHYSIASSQNVVGDSVHLLIVTVDWRTPDGRVKHGQCTRYLNALRPGDKVMTSLKPSVMKLPPSPLQPIIMAGLGTGAAPFRAFLQEKAWQRSKGIEIGPLVYYFGSRYSSQEYLYGEEIEAYILDGILTHGRMAFSRDTHKKVYIQHRMQEDGDMLVDYLKEGVFYLCGPTWPVPDVYQALLDAHVKRGVPLAEAEEYIERLKEEERYVLEVY